METLNLNTLANSLPTAQQKADQELLNNFKGTFIFFLKEMTSLTVPKPRPSALPHSIARHARMPNAPTMQDTPLHARIFLR
jgi:hypothetical protein